MDQSDREKNEVRLQLAPEEMRSLGYRVVDMLVDHYTGLPDRPVAGKGSRPELEAMLREPIPEKGRGMEEVLARVRDTVFGNMSHVDHPRFFAYVPGPGNFVGAMADALVAGFNPFAGAWATASGGAEVELVTVDWLRELCALPASAGGTFVSGGSMANLTALAIARTSTERNDGIIYCSDQTHSSIERGAGVLGFSPSQLRILPSDRDARLSVELFRESLDTDGAAGLLPLALVANAGTTSSGAVDPLEELSTICHERGIWMHVDGAYGAAALLGSSGRELLAGIEHADSISLDPHKWLFQPFGCGCILVRDARRLSDTFRLVPDYLKDSDLLLEEVNFRDRGVELTRELRALKLWMSLQVFGAESFRAAIDRGMELAQIAERTLRAGECWDIVTRAQLGIVTFRYRDDRRSEEELDHMSVRLAEEMMLDGFAMLSTTKLHGRTVLRLCTINPRTTDEDITTTIAMLGEMARKLR